MVSPVRERVPELQIEAAVEPHVFAALAWQQRMLADDELAKTQLVTPRCWLRTW